MSFDAVHPAFRCGVEAAARAIGREGPVALGEGDTRYEAAEGAVRLQLAVRHGTVRRAAHAGATDPAQRAVLDVFCATLEGLPVQEAAQHAGLHVLHRLRDRGAGAPVKGILTPANAGPLFALPVRLMRQVYGAYRQETGDPEVANRYAPDLPADWLALDEQAKADRLKPLLAEFLAERGLAADALWLVSIDRQVRVVIAVDERIGPAEKPPLLMAFERAMRRATGIRLEIGMAEMRDTNKIRRL